MYRQSLGVDAKIIAITYLAAATATLDASLAHRHAKLVICLCSWRTDIPRWGVPLVGMNE
ncbi:hypothetical protein HZB03_00880 [Candidatus Woesearchaeota archaeon]|nr:hypothetical protein [Candidatus Woesearchaeota archaeon]